MTLVSNVIPLSRKVWICQSPFGDPSPEPLEEYELGWFETVALLIVTSSQSSKHSHSQTPESYVLIDRGFSEDRSEIWFPLNPAYDVQTLYGAFFRMEDARDWWAMIVNMATGD